MAGTASHQQGQRVAVQEKQYIRELGGSLRVFGPLYVGIACITNHAD